MQVTLFHFEDKPRADSVDVITTLQNEGNLRVMMLTGDHDLSAWRVADAVGIKEVHCSLKPEDKLYHVTKISRDTGIFYYEFLSESLYVYFFSLLEISFR